MNDGEPVTKKNQEDANMQIVKKYKVGDVINGLDYPGCKSFDTLEGAKNFRTELLEECKRSWVESGSDFVIDESDTKKHFYLAAENEDGEWVQVDEDGEWVIK